MGKDTKIRDRLKTVYKLLKLKFSSKNSFPLVVRWDITARCPIRCRYCKIWEMNTLEVGTGKILQIIDEMANLGIEKISFSGGEPLLRDDICEIISYAKHRGIFPEMNSSGFGFPERVDRLNCLGLLKLSLDGPPEINDMVRGRKGSYQWAIDAATYAKRYKIRFVFCTTLTGYNIDHVEYMLKLANEFNTMVRFQPLKDIRYLKYNSFIDSKDEKLIPSQQQFRRAIDILIRYSRKNSNLISNSQRSLRHIYHWPHYSRLRCWAGKAFCMIDPSGYVSPCDRLHYHKELPNCAESSFIEAIRNMPSLPACAGCGFLGSLALNYLMNIKFDMHLFKHMLK